MGRARRWLKGLFGIKKDREELDNNNKRQSSNSSGLCNNPATIPPNISVAEASWLRSCSCTDEAEKEQNKRAIAVAAATAAAADAAVAAAQAAVAVIRLTSNGRGAMFDGGLEGQAAVKIQAVFRGYLARKALRALKGLVKLQAHVRGYLVRKQAAATLHSFEALMRAQVGARLQRSARRGGGGGGGDNTCRLGFGTRKPMERYDGKTRNEHEHTLAAATHDRRLSASIVDSTAFDRASEDTSRIVEVDNAVMPISGSGQTPPSRAPTGHFRSSHWLDDPGPSTTPGSTPRSMNTPVRSEFGSGCLFRRRESCGLHVVPNYMFGTQSSKAKLRSQSAPKQRVGAVEAPRNRLSLQEVMMEYERSRSSLSGAVGVRMQRSCSQAQEAIVFKNAVTGKMKMERP